MAATTSTSNPGATSSTILDDKSPICIPFILNHLSSHLTSQTSQSTPSPRPLIIGLNGVQGVGKTTLVTSLSSTLASQGHETLVISIDDFYLPHADQTALASSHPDNALLQQRGEPGTHDIPLATRFFADLLAGREAKVPSYDKSAFAGQGDRAPESTWHTVNGPSSPRIQVVILEGWCVGFRPLPESEVSTRWNSPSRTLANHKLEHLLHVNTNLRAYDALTELLDVFVHVDAEDNLYAYDWRLQQEAALRRDRGTGMTDEQVVSFVDGYYPAYELFSDNLRKGIFGGKAGRQLRLVVGKDRRVKESQII